MAGKNIQKRVEEFATNLGFDPELARVLPVQVTVEALDAEVSDELIATLASQGIKEAAEPVTESGKPRMLKVTAWIAHAGPANRNGDAFLAEDLKEVAEDGLFLPPYVGMIDFNHDFIPYGIWFDARYEYDPVAKEYGLIAEGTVFAWRFNEIADKVLAEQARNGSVAVSMACIAGSIETRNGESGLTEHVLRKPVFLTASMLDVAPADPNARGVGDEDEGSSSTERLVQLNQAFMDLNSTDAEAVLATLRQAVVDSQAHQKTQQEEDMDVEQIVAQLTEAFGGKADEIVSELREAVADAAKVPGLEARVAELEAAAEEANAQVASLQTDLDVAQTALEAKTTELAELTEAHETTTTELNALVEANKAKEREVIREARLAKLPESYRKALEAREDESKNRIVARLVEMSEEEFGEELELLVANSPNKQSLTDKSRAEGMLSTFAGSGGSGYAIDKFLN